MIECAKIEGSKTGKLKEEAVNRLKKGKFSLGPDLRNVVCFVWTLFVKQYILVFSKKRFSLSKVN